MTPTQETPELQQSHRRDLTTPILVSLPVLLAMAAVAVEVLA